MRSRLFTIRRSIFFCFLAVIILQSGCSQIEENTTINCKVIPGLDTLLGAGQVLLLGEIHGTKEAPAYVHHIACQALQKDLSVIVGLELPSADQAQFDRFLQSEGTKKDRDLILQLPFWARDYQDGRASSAMFNLLEAIRQLKANQVNIEVALIDDPNAPDRDLLMASNIVAKAQQNPEHFFIVLTGNYHNRIADGSGQMGSWVLKRLGVERVVSLNQSHQGGTAWACVSGEGCGAFRFGGRGRNEIGVFLDKEMTNYHGTLEMDSIHVAFPAKDVIDNS